METASTISLVDIIAVLIIIIGVIHGFRQGASPSFAWFCGAMVGLLAAVVTYPVLERVINRSGDVDVTLLSFMSLMGSVMVAFLVLILIRQLIAQFSKLSSHLLMDRIGGSVAGLVQTSVMVILFYIAFTSIDNPFLYRTFGVESAIGRPLVKIKDKFGQAVIKDYQKTQDRMMQQRDKRSDDRTQPK